uniref:Uncharacterized protein n=1 Tax=Pyramimonas orientalis virus TaxID=455367 RepID=A0A7M3UP85_POV01|nr:hypothetical protein HWQ62_00425 [Pyramimonas orientalis virus]
MINNTDADNQCFINDKKITCEDLCYSMGYSEIAIGPFLTFMLTVTSIIIIYCIVFSVLRKKCSLAHTTNTSTASKETQCTEYPLQQILIHPDNTINFLQSEDL